MAPSAQLVRLRVSASGQVALGDQVGSGRGAWIHPDPACVAQAQKRRAFARAFRAEVDCDTAGLIRAMGLTDEEGTPKSPGS